MSNSEMLSVVQPSDGALIKDVPLNSWEQVDAMLVTAQRLSTDKTRWLPAYQRKEILKKLVTLMTPEIDAFALLIAREGGKPLQDAKVEALRAVNGVEIAIEDMANLAGKQVPMDLTPAGAGRIAFTRKEPIGVVAALSAFNHPLNLIVHQVIPAIATGCPVIVKPASTTPLSCIKLVNMLHEAGLPKVWCQVCVCKSSVAEKLATDERTKFVTFIGSGRVGWYLRSKLAAGTRCALEHGGVAPVIICDDADLDKAVPLVVKGGYYHAGQVCVSVQRIYVSNAIKAAFLEKFCYEVLRLKVGDATLPDTEVGPLIVPSEVDRVEAWVNEAVEGGATVPVGGARMNDYFYEPTILVEPPQDAKVSKEEVFGPVTCVYGFDDVEEAITRANALPVSFQSAAFTQDINQAMMLSERLEAAAVMINDHTAFRVDWMPFAGHAASGYGTGGIPFTMEDMMKDKLTVIKVS